MLPPNYSNTWATFSDYLEGATFHTLKSNSIGKMIILRFSGIAIKKDCYLVKIAILFWRRWRDSAAFAPCVRRRKSKYRPVFELVDEGPAGAFDPHSNLSILYEKHIPRPKGGGYVFMAEMERFELSRSFWPLHDFQSCALDQLRDISTYLLKNIPVRLSAWLL